MSGENAQEEMMREIMRLKEELLRKGEELSRTESRLRGLLQIKDRFLSLATHDIRTPITTLKLIANIVERSADQLPDLLQRTVGTLPRNVAKLEAKVDDLVRIARLDVDDFVPELEAVDWNEQIKAAIASCFASAVQRGIELDLQLNETATVHADTEHIRQMMVDLIRTSMDRLDLGGHLVVESGISSQTGPNPGAWFLVQDNGPAFNDTHAELLLQDLTGSQQQTRVRVPLFMAHRVAIAHSGVIEIGHSSSGGIRLYAWIPLKQKDTEENPPETRHDDQHNHHTEKPIISGEVNHG